MRLKFTSSAIKQGDQKAKVWYSMGRECQEITIYAENYRGFSDLDFDGYENLNYRDDSDSMTDYFCKPSLTIFPENKIYAEVKAAFDRQQEIRDARAERKQAKRNEKKLEFSQLLEQQPEKYKIVKGVKFEIIKSTPHSVHEGFTSYEMKKWNSKSTKTSYYSESADKKRYIPLRTI